MGVIRHLRDLAGLIGLPKDQRRLVFYSEGKNYWPYLEGLLLQILATTDIPVCYLSSDHDDPGLHLKHSHLRTFKTDEGFIRNWLFENIETDVMVMTMPDLQQYQVKRSHHPVHYIYVQHSLVSLHMIYRKGAFDFYDTLFCAGPHHIEEARALETAYKLPKKILVEHGYGRLDSLLLEASQKKTTPTEDDAPQHVLLAPSWGDHATIESGVGERLVDELLTRGYRVTLRPHPQTIRLSKVKVDAIVNKHKSNPLFFYENNVAGQSSLFQSDIMISDWSGAALDYAFGLNKPVYFVDVPRKINNSDYKDIDITPIEVSIREEVGAVIDPNNIQFPEVIPNISCEGRVFNPGQSSTVGAEYIRKLLAHE